MENGCADFIMLDPALRPRTWEDGNGQDKRRIRKKVTVSLLNANTEFIRLRVLPSNPEKFHGYFARGVHECVDVWLKQLGDDIPRIPHRDNDDEFSYSTESITLMPDTLVAVDRIVGFWKGTNEQCSRSQVIDYFITLTREANELQDGKA